MNGSAVKGDDLLRHGETEAGSRALGGEQRLKDILQDRCTHSCTCVTHGKQNHLRGDVPEGIMLPIPALGDGQCDRAGTRHRVARVDHEIGDHLLQLN